MRARFISIGLVAIMAASIWVGCGSVGEQDAEYKLSKGIWLQGIGDFVRAKREFERVLSDYPETKAATEAQTMLDQIKVAMLNRAHELKDRGQFAKAEGLCNRIISEYRGTNEASAAEGLLNLMRERYNRVAYEDLRQAYRVAQDYFDDYPTGKIDLERLHYYGLEESPGVTFEILGDRREELVMTGQHSAGSKIYTVFHDGRVEEKGRD